MQVKRKTRNKRCLSCQDLFQANPRTKGKQKYCSKESCQKYRQRKNEKQWRKRNPECVQIQREQTRKWFKTHPEYSSERRRAYPELLERNRKQSQERMKKMRSERLFDKSKVILTQVVGGKPDKCYLARGGSWLMVRLTKASPLSRVNKLRDNGGRTQSVANCLPQGRLYEMDQFFKP